MVYNQPMKILIAPLITKQRADAAYHITRTMCDLFTQRQHALAISASKRNSIATASLYEAAEPKPPRFVRREQYSYEEWLYAHGAVSREYLETDLECMNEAIDKFRPDLIIVMDRIAAVIAARLHHIPCITIVNTSMYRSFSFPLRILQPLNQLLSDVGLEQIFRISELYDYCTDRAVFGAIQIQPTPPETDVRRFGSVSFITPLPQIARDVYISFSSVRKKSTALRKMIIDAFQGAPYQVYAAVMDLEAEKVENIHFLAFHRDDLLRSAAVCIHDGNDYICDLCCQNAIPQLIITDHNYGRTSNALAARRYGFGLMADENDLSMATLYENYRKLVASEHYQENAAKIRDEVISLGDFEDFYRFILSRFRK